MDATNRPTFRGIKKFTRSAQYKVNISWSYLEEWILHEDTIDLDPAFQRGYVWTPEQKSRYVEFILRGGTSGREINFNCPTWMGKHSPSLRAKYGNNQAPLVIVDGKQRLDAVRGFLRDEVPAFGHKYSDFSDKLGMSGPDFVVCVNDLETDAEVYQWYLDMNEGGTVHTAAELDKVRALIEGAAAALDDEPAK